MNTKRVLSFLAAVVLVLSTSLTAMASSHREAPLISNDPLADNTDLYAFRSPGPTADDQNTITIIANYIPFELPEGGPNYFNFGENIHYEIHIRNQAVATGPGNGDDITYRFTFTQTNEDPTTFFNIRLGKQNLKTTYLCQKSVDGGVSWTTVLDGGIVPPTDIGPRSIDNTTVGLGKPYSTIWNNAITTANSGETLFCGPVDDPFFVDLAGIFDLGNFRKDGKVDALAGFNCHAICMKIPISMLQAGGLSVTSAKNILDPAFVIGVWASASRPAITTLNTDGSKTVSGNYVQVSRLGMPLTNEAIIPIGMKDKWNATSPYNDLPYAANFTNPELALYCGNGAYGAAVGTLLDLRIDTNSLGAGFDFRNGKNGLYGLYATNGGKGTALDTTSAGFGKILLQPNAPRSVDILPIFYTGVPNLAPYQLATGKTSGNPLANGKPFINNFLPTLGDMLRLNMAVPVTPRNDPNFSSEGLIQAAAIGLTVAPFNTTANLENIPNMDGFPNGRRLEDDVTRIEMQAVGGLVLNAIGLWTDDYKPGVSTSPVTAQLGAKLGWNAGIEHNDTTFRTTWPYLALPHRGSDGLRSMSSVQSHQPNGINIRAPRNFFSSSNYPNPVATSTTLNYHLTDGGDINIIVTDMNGREVSTITNSYQSPGDYSINWKPSQNLSAGTYIVTLLVDGQHSNDMKVTFTK